MVLVDNIQAYIDLHPDLEDAAPGKGQVPADYMIIGMAPSMKRPESHFNEPFGSKSQALIAELVKQHPSIYSTNLVKTPHPVGKKVPVKLMRQFYPSLVTEVKWVKPKRILAVGGQVASVLCPGFTELREDHGTFFYNPDLEAYVIPTFLFSAVIKSQDLRPFMRRDLDRFFNLPDPVAPKYKTVTSIPAMPEMCDVYLDIENAFFEEGGRWPRVTLVGWTWDDKKGVYQLKNPTPKQLLELRAALQTGIKTVIGHGLTFDLGQLGKASGKPWRVLVKDTLIDSHVLGEEVHNLKHLSIMHTDRAGSRAFGGTDDAAYNAEDVLAEREVNSYFESVVEERGQKSFIARVLYRLVPHVAEMEVRGTFIDRALLLTMLEDYRKKHRKLLHQLQKYGKEDTNWNSDDQVADIFTEQGVKLRDKTPSGKRYSVAEPIIAPLREKYPIVDLFLRFQECTKYLEFLQDYEQRTTETPYLHPKIKMTGARTGRWSTEDPNVQQVPREGPIKLLYRSRFKNGRIGLVDLSGAELRVVAILAGDKAMAKALMGSDFHADVASSVYGVPLDQVTPAQRKKSKGVTFGVLYGGGDQGLSARTGSNPKEVKQIKDTLAKRFPDLDRWQRKQERFGMKHKYSEQIMGRRRSLVSLYYEEGEGGMKRKSVNTPVQGTANDLNLCIMEVAANEILKRKLKSRINFPVHDAILIDIYPGEADAVVDCIQQGFNALKATPFGQLPLFDVLPMIGEMRIGKTWANCESTNENYNSERSEAFSSHENP